MRDLSPHKVPLVPRSFQNFMHKRLVELFGLCELCCVVLLFIAFVSYNPSDPSLNSYGIRITKNPLGAIGSLAADLMHQTFGHACYIILLALAVQGYEITAHKPQRTLTTRNSILVFTAMILMSTGAAFVFPSMAGGAIGWIGKQLCTSTTPLFNFKLFSVLIGLGFWLSGLYLAINSLKLSLTSIKDLLYQTITAMLKNLTRSSERIGSIEPFSSLRIKSISEQENHATNDYSVDSGKQFSGGAGLSSGENSRESYSKEKNLSSGKEEGIIINNFSVTGHIKVEAKKRGREVSSSGDIHERGFLPPVELLAQPTTTQKTPNPQSLDRASELQSVLEDFGIRGRIVKVRFGPVVTLYELEPAAGIKSSRIISLADDISRSMSAVSARVAIVPGKNVIGIELPNVQREKVYLRELITSEIYQNNPAALSLVLGKDIEGSPIIADLARMPHLLLAGTTGSGKSVAINTMILSLLYRLTPEQCKFIMIDPKMLELSVYDGIPHLLAPVVTDPKKAVSALKWVVREMEDRYRSMSTVGVRNIEGYNLRIKEAINSGETLKKRVQTGFDKETGDPIIEFVELPMRSLPFIVVVVDEMADLMLVAGKEIENAVQRLAQMARAAGIHLIMATQRPSVDVITGTIKANFPSRISFHVTSKIDSRTILGEQGAEQLLGQGDMLYMASASRIMRVHGPFVTDREIESIVNYLKKIDFPSETIDITHDDDDESPPDTTADRGDYDALYDQAVALVCRERKASTSYLQRHFQIGYNRAARMIDRMEEDGVISPSNAVGRREVLIAQR